MPLPFFKIPAMHLLALGLVCFLAIVPFFWQGSPSGHDFEFHMFSWMEVLRQWKQGHVYPRWAPLAHWGYGEARFLFYPPASWMMGAGLGVALPWKEVPGAYCWLALLFAGMAMYKLARTWLAPGDALFAAVLYAVNPYHLLVVYWRSALAELLAASLLPLLFLAILRLTESGPRPVIGLGLIFAAAWLVNAPAAMMIHYSAAGLAAGSAILHRSGRILWRTTLAVLLGAGLASFYLIPAVYETRWVNIGEVLAPGLRPQDNFLFTNTAEPEHNQFNRLVSTVAATEIAFLALAIWVSRKERGKKNPRWLLLALWSSGAALIMVAISAPFWRILPKLQFVQLPWRWLLCLNVGMVLLLTMAIRRRVWRAAAALVLIAALWLAGHRIQPPWWDSAADITEMSDAIADASGYEGTDEYVPAGVDPYELNKDLPQVTASFLQTAPAKVLEWNSEDRRVVVQAGSAGIVTLRLFNYPAWEATVNGQAVATQSTEVTGLMQIAVAAGTNDIRVHFGRTLDRKLGAGASLLSLALLAGVWMRVRRRA